MTTKNLARIRRVSAVLQWACTGYLVLAPLLWAGVWLNFRQWGPRWEVLRQMPIQPEFVGPLNLLLAALVSGVPLALLLFGVWRLRRLFGLFRAGVLFSVEGAGHLLRFAHMVLATVLLTPVISALLSVVLTLGNPPGQRALMLSFGSDDLSRLFAAGVLVAIAWILREAHRLQAENEAFV